MSIKKFFSFELSKVILLLVFILLTYAIPKQTEICSPSVDDKISCYNIDISGIGYPVFYGQIFYNDLVNGFEFNLIYFVINLIIFYSLACFVVYIFSKFY